MALKSSKQLDEERRKASRVPPKLGASAGQQAPKPSPIRKRGLTIGLVAAGAMTIFGISSWERQSDCQPNPNGDQTCPQGSGSSSSGGGRSYFSSWGSSSSGTYWGSSGHSSGTSGISSALVARGGFGSTGGFHASGGG
ncbi:hypothetical protein PY365_03185 [Roseiarcaceae bacterium H3SJ34-1]|uniref:hypothetical protein n=1 Tax=Terripilifer ovatus TaxID=3032367 RepID=UPI003AB9572F|nr:hypothetical protein [Roseiarcaceae bacterium H3SJ34-1]